MKDSQEPYIVILAAGRGTRLGGETPKQYLKVTGKSILRHTLETFEGYNNIQLVIGADDHALYEEAIKGLDLPSPIIGGQTRQESVHNALKALNLNDDDIVLIHDAARPLVSKTEINELIEAMGQYKAATLAAPVADTLRRKDKIIDRDELWAVQTPQAFGYGTLKQAHEQAQGAHTDDTSLVSAMGIEVKIVPASRRNFKITTQEDLQMFSALLSANKTPRTATGFDVHAFATEATDKPLILCGVEIPDAHPLAGHSDADVGLHALTDALLGCIAAGDIGLHFPPSDPAFKGKDSAFFLEHAVELVKEKGGEITYLDLTLICEAPKIGPYRDQMRARIAEITGLTIDQVSLKATTTEGLGFTGRKEGIAAQACASILL